MKRSVKMMLALLLTLAMVLGLIGCATTPPVEESTPTTQAPTTEPIVEPEGSNAPVISITEENTYTKPLNNIPEVPYWFPAELLEWNAGENPTDAYNVSAVALAQRVDKEKLTPANSTQNKDVKVVAISIMNSSTSGNAPHGLNSVSANIFSYWQYIDTLVYWGGSSGEGLIVTPSADVIDVAHKNGVPVLGTVFFPQAAHGGKIGWLNDFLQKDEDGNFPMVAKLIEVCEYFGFDGWFINQETEGSESDPDGVLTAEHAVLMQEFIKAFKAEAGDSLQLMWYDSMTVDGEMDWQNALTDKNKYFVIGDDQEAVADSMFLNFWWNTRTYAPDELLKATAEKAEELGVDPYDIYAGIDVQANGTKTNVRWHLYAPDGQPYTSLGLYCPSWTYFAAEDFYTDFQEKESQFWVNAKGDPFVDVVAQEGKWAGISTYAIEKTVVQSVPFVTNFSTGNGYNFFINGTKVSAKDWNNRSMQDVLPTYRWHLEQGEGNGLAAIMDYSDAYYGGTSVKLYGKMAKDQPTTLKLYSSDLDVTDGLSFTAKAKCSVELTLDLVVTLSDGTTEILAGDKKVGEEWTNITFDISGLVGKTISGFDIRVTSAEDVYGVKFLLGQIAITDPTATAETSASDLVVESTSFDDDDCIYAGICLKWAGSENADRYEIYRINQDGSYSFIDVTTGTALYINALERNDDTNKTDLMVVPVNVYGERGTASNVATVQWPDNSLPKADFKVSTTLAAPDQKITFESLCSANTETITWEFPGANVETSTEATPTVSYAAEGTYTVRVTAKNASGEITAEKVDIITISSKVTGELALLSAGKDTEASGYVNDNEAPPFAVDGDLSKKWCATGNPAHWIVIDLGEVKTVSEVKIFHAQAGGESADMNTKAYQILVSEDGENFTEVVKVTKNSLGETSDTFAAVSARYVKLVVEKPTQGSDTAARIYEIEVYGLDEML